MPHAPRHRPLVRRVTTYARRNAVAFLALFVALGGTGAYAANTIGSEDIIDGSILAADIRNGQVGRADLTDSVITSTKINNGSVINSELGTNAVTSPKVAADALTGDDIDEATLGVTQGGRTATAEVGHHANCVSHALATRTLTVGRPTRLLVDGDASFLANEGNFRQGRISVVIRDAGGTALARMRSETAEPPIDTTGAVEIDGILETDAGTPLTLAAGTYTVALEVYNFGNCSRQTYWSGIDLTYLRVADAD